MNKKRNWRAIFTWVLAIFAVLYTLPSIIGSPGDWYPFTKTLRGGLDLAGGLELRYTVDWKQSIEDSTRKTGETLQAHVVEQLAKDAQESFADLPSEKYDAYLKRMKLEMSDIDRVQVTFLDDGVWGAFQKLKAEGDPMATIDSRFEMSTGDKVVSILLPDKLAQEIRKQVVKDTRDNLDKRVGGMGLVDPDVRITGDSDIAVQVPGVGKAQMDVVRQVLGKTAQLTMRFIDTNSSFLGGGDVQAAVAAFKEKNPSSDLAVRNTYGGVLTAHNKSDLVRFVQTLKVPDDHYVAYEWTEDTDPNDGTVREKYWRAVYLRAKVEIQGSHLSRARANYNEKNQPIVLLDLNSEGGRLFGEATGNNIGGLLAILLDDDIQSAPRIEGKIPGGRAVITMGARGGQRALKEAQTLAQVLNQGAYSAPVYKVHDHDVGPSLGKDSVSAGAMSLGVGFVVIVLFMMLYYKGAGVIATICVCFCMLLTFLLLVSFNTALTMPGVAGIVLTLAMTVDANIIVYERIREELRLGKTPRIAVDTGFARAFSAILDGNLTTAITAVALMNFTSGTMHNFAVTLLVGIATSMFAAVFVSRLIFNGWIAAKKPTTLSI